MLVINAHFRRLTEISLVDAYDEMGVYVLWSAHASVRPSYIGEGNVLRRFVDHMGKSWAARPIHGMMAFLDHVTVKQTKAAGELIEAALLEIADGIDRYPSNNAASGKRKSFGRLLRGRSDATVRIVVSGQDPLLPPEKPPMREDKWIVIRDHGNDEWHIDEAHWNARPRSA